MTATKKKAGSPGFKGGYLGKVLRVGICPAERSAKRAFRRRTCSRNSSGVGDSGWNVTPRLIDRPAEGKGVRPYLVEYYRLIGWDEKTGKPWRSTLKSVGLEHIGDDIWK